MAKPKELQIAITVSATKAKEQVADFTSYIRKQAEAIGKLMSGGITGSSSLAMKMKEAKVMVDKQTKTGQSPTAKAAEDTSKHVKGVNKQYDAQLIKVDKISKALETAKKKQIDLEAKRPRPDQEADIVKRHKRDMKKAGKTVPTVKVETGAEKTIKKVTEKIKEQKQQVDKLKLSIKGAKQEYDRLMAKQPKQQRVVAMSKEDKANLKRLPEQKVKQTKASMVADKAIKAQKKSLDELTASAALAEKQLAKLRKQKGALPKAQPKVKPQFTQKQLDKMGKEMDKPIVSDQSAKNLQKITAEIKKQQKEVKRLQKEFDKADKKFKKINMSMLRAQDRKLKAPVIQKEVEKLEKKVPVVKVVGKPDATLKELKKSLEASQKNVDKLTKSLEKANQQVKMLNATPIQTKQQKVMAGHKADFKAASEHEDYAFTEKRKVYKKSGITDAERRDAAIRTAELAKRKEIVSRISRPVQKMLGITQKQVARMFNLKDAIQQIKVFKKAAKGIDTVLTTHVSRKGMDNTEFQALSRLLNILKIQLTEIRLLEGQVLQTQFRSRTKGTTKSMPLTFGKGTQDARLTSSSDIDRTLVQADKEVRRQKYTPHTTEMKAAQRAIQQRVVQAQALMSQPGYMPSHLQRFDSSMDMEKMFPKELTIGKGRDPFVSQGPAIELGSKAAGKAIAGEQQRRNEALKIWNQFTKQGIEPNKRQIEILKQMSKEYKVLGDKIRKAGFDLNKFNSPKQLAQQKMTANMQKVFKTPGFDKKQFQQYWTTISSGGTVKGNIPMGASGVSQGTHAEMRRLMDDSPAFEKRMTGMFKKYGVNISKTHNRLQSFMASTKNFMKFQLEWFAGAGLIFGIIGGIRQLVTESMKFEQALANIKAVTGASNKEMHMFSNAAKRMSQETPLAASEISMLAQTLIRAGLSAEMTVHAMELASKITTVTGEDAKMVASTIATATFAWRLRAEDMVKVGNVLAGTLNFSRLEVQDLAEAFKYFGATARAFNKDFYETNALLASFSNLGFSASQIGTSMVQILASLEAPTKKSRDIMKSIGIDPQQISGMMKFADIVEKFAQHGLTAGQAMQIMRRRGGRLFAAALVAGGDYFREMEVKIRESEQLSKGFDSAMAATINAWKRLWNQFVRVAIDIGNFLLPPIRLLINLLTVLTNAFTHLFNGLTLGGNMFVGLSEAVLATLFIMRRFRKEVAVTAAVVNTSSFSTAAALALSAKGNKAIAAGAGGAVAGAMGGGFMGVIKKWGLKIFGWLKKLFKKIGGWRGAALIGVGVGVLTILDKIFGEKKTISETGKELDKVADSMEKLGEGMRKIDEKALKDISKTIQSIKAGVGGWQLPGDFDIGASDAMKRATANYAAARKELQESLEIKRAPIEEDIARIEKRLDEMDKGWSDQFEGFWESWAIGAERSIDAIKDDLEDLSDNSVLKFLFGDSATAKIQIDKAETPKELVAAGKTLSEAKPGFFANMLTPTFMKSIDQIINEGALAKKWEAIERETLEETLTLQGKQTRQVKPDLGVGGEGSFTINVAPIDTSAMDILKEKAARLQRTLDELQKTKTNIPTGVGAAGLITITQPSVPQAPRNFRAEDLSNKVILSAINRAEGGLKAEYGYGIRSIQTKDREDARGIALNSIINNKERFANQTESTDFIAFMRDRFAPIGAGNDPKNLNKNWEPNVKYFLKEFFNKVGAATKSSDSGFFPKYPYGGPVSDERKDIEALNTYDKALETASQLQQVNVQIEDLRKAEAVGLTREIKSDPSQYNMDYNYQTPVAQEKANTVAMAGFELERVAAASRKLGKAEQYEQTLTQTAVNLAGYDDKLLAAIEAQKTIAAQLKAKVEGVTPEQLKKAEHVTSAAQIQRDQFAEIGGATVREAAIAVEKAEYKPGAKRIQLGKAQMDIDKVKARHLAENAKLTAERVFNATKAGLDRETWLNEEFFKMNLVSAKGYYDEKLRLLNSSNQAESLRLKDNHDAAMTQLESNKGFIIKQIKTIQAEINRAGENYGSVEKLRADIKDPDFEKGKAKLSDAASIAYDTGAARIGDEKVALKKQADLVRKIETGKQEYKDQNVVRAKALKLAEEQLILQQKIKVATWDDTKAKELLTKQREILQLQSQANELAGNWNALMADKVKLVEKDRASALLNLSMEKRSLEVQKDFAQGKKEFTTVKHLEKLLKLYPKYEAAIQKVYDLRKREAELMTTDLGQATKAIEDILKDIDKKFSTVVYDVIKMTVDGIRTGLSDALVDAMKGFPKQKEIKHQISLTEADRADVQAGMPGIQEQMALLEQQKTALTQGFDAGRMTQEQYINRMSDLNQQLNEANKQWRDGQREIRQYNEEINKANESLTGWLKYFMKVFDAIQKKLADLIADKAIDWILNLGLKIGGLFLGASSGAGNLTDANNSAINMTGDSLWMSSHSGGYIPKYHDGGYIQRSHDGGQLKQDKVSSPGSAFPKFTYGGAVRDKEVKPIEFPGFPALNDIQKYTDITKLKYDEVPIIGQTAEYMISRKGVEAAGVDALDRINKGDVSQLQDTTSILNIIKNYHSMQTEDVNTFHDGGFVSKVLHDGGGTQDAIDRMMHSDVASGSGSTSSWAGSGMGMSTSPSTGSGGTIPASQGVSAAGGSPSFAGSGILGRAFTAMMQGKKMHDGGLNDLKSDEVPAILQKGEYVISRQGVEAFDISILDKINTGKADTRYFQSITHDDRKAADNGFDTPRYHTGGYVPKSYHEGGQAGTYKSNAQKSQGSEMETGTINNNYFIQAVDARSFSDLVERNPDSIVKVLDDSGRRNGNFRRTMQNHL